MSKITRNEIEETKYGRYLLSDENIYLSVYSLNSYVFEYNLLEADDRILYHRLQDKFDRVCVDDTISKVRNRIIELLDEDNYIEAKVYFKPKKISEKKMKMLVLKIIRIIIKFIQKTQRNFMKVIFMELKCI